MVKSLEQLVTVSLTETSLSILVSPGSGVPQKQSVTGFLTEAWTGNPIADRNINLWITEGTAEPTLYGTSKTFSDGSFGWFLVPVSENTYVFEVEFLGDSAYVQSYARATCTFMKVGSALSLTVDPMSGNVPLNVLISGKLTRVDTRAGLGGRTVNLYRNAVLVASAKTSVDPTTLGNYAFSDTLTEAGSYTYYAEFAGDDLFAGCPEEDKVKVQTKNSKMPLLFATLGFFGILTFYE